MSTVLSKSDQMVESLTTLTKNTLTMGIGSSYKTGLNVQSVVEEEHKLSKDNVSHQNPKMVNHAMEMKSWPDLATYKIALKMEKMKLIMINKKMSSCKLDNFLEDSKELRDVFWLKEIWT